MTPAYTNVFITSIEQETSIFTHFQQENSYICDIWARHGTCNVNLHTFSARTLLCLRYLGKVLGTCTEDEEKLKKFYKYFNNFHTTVKFTIDY